MTRSSGFIRSRDVELADRQLNYRPVPGAMMRAPVVAPDVGLVGLGPR